MIDFAIHYMLSDADDRSVASIQLCQTCEGVNINKEKKFKTKVVAPQYFVEDPVAELEEWNRLAEKEIKSQEESQRDEEEQMEDEARIKVSTDSKDSSQSKKEFMDDTQCVQFAPNIARAKDEQELIMEIQPPEPVQTDQVDEKKKLTKLGMNTAVAIGLHNFPEGENIVHRRFHKKFAQRINHDICFIILHVLFNEKVLPLS